MINYSLKLSNKELVLDKSKIKFSKNDLIIKIKSCGICGSDINILKNGSFRVKNGTVMGHEISGEIISQNSHSRKKYIFLGADIPNKQKLDYALGHEIDGGFQKYLVLNNKLFKKIPHFITTKKINFKIASLCEPIACCLNGFKNLNFKKNRSVIIFGAGPIGQLLALICVYKKAKEVFLFDENKKKIELGPQNKIIHKFHTKHLSKILKSEKKFDYGFVACSSMKAQNEILNHMKKNSAVNFFAGIKYKGKSKLTPINTNLIHYNQIKIVGSHGSTRSDIIESAKIIIEDKINLKGIITKSYNIKEFKNAFRDLKNGKVLKAVITP